MGIVVDADNSHVYIYNYYVVVYVQLHTYRRIGIEDANLKTFDLDWKTFC